MTTEQAAQLLQQNAQLIEQNALFLDFCAQVLPVLLVLAAAWAGLFLGRLVKF